MLDARTLGSPRGGAVETPVKAARLRGEPPTRAGEVAQDAQADCDGEGYIAAPERDAAFLPPSSCSLRLSANMHVLHEMHDFIALHDLHDLHVLHDLHGFITLHDLNDLHEMHDVHALHDTPKAAIMQNMHALKTMQTMHFMQQAEVERPGFAYLALLFSGGANIPAADVSH